MADTQSIQFGDPRLPWRFWRRVEVDANGCWLWTGSISKQGYGRCYFDRTERNAQCHSLAVRKLVGPIPEGLQCDHLCRVRRCCNPAHIELVTNRVNILRGVGFSALNAAKKFCARGHPFEEPNLHRDKHGNRRCLTCRRAAAVEHRKRYVESLHTKERRRHNDRRKREKAELIALRLECSRLRADGATLKARADEALAAHSASFGALATLSAALFDGEVDDYAALAEKIIARVRQLEADGATLRERVRTREEAERTLTILAMEKIFNHPKASTWPYTEVRSGVLDLIFASAPKEQR